MSVWRVVRQVVRNAVAPCVFLALAGYFAWGAWQGDRGLQAATKRAEALAAAHQDVDNANAEQAVWQRRVAALQSANLDRDALDERVRDRLNLAAPSDIIVMYPPGQKVF